MYKLILADDEELEREALRFFITGSDLPPFSITECATGTELLKTALDIQPDIILLDINMPGLNGLEALKQIREKGGLAQVIISSAYNQFDYAVKAMKLGVIDFLVKPVKREILLDALKKAAGNLPDTDAGDAIPAAGTAALTGSAKTAAAGTAAEPVPANIKKILAYLDANFNRQTGLDDIADHCGCSKYHLSHMFKLRTGKNISDYLLEKRMNAAITLLDSTDCSIKEISSRIGYSDPNYFTLVFKKYTGIPPQQYRNRL